MDDFKWLNVGNINRRASQWLANIKILCTFFFRPNPSVEVNLESMPTFLATDLTYTFLKLPF